MKIAVSACLLGYACRYDGKSKPVEHICELAHQHSLIPVCPEQIGGLPTPRAPSEIQSDGSVKNACGADVTREYREGAEAVLKIIRENNCELAILKEKSPACGSGWIYDGSFSKRLIRGDGICTSLLKQNQIRVFGENSEDLQKLINSENS